MDFSSIAVGLIAGSLARILLLRIDYRQYPSSPHGAISHLTFGVIAAAVGAVVVPALLAEEFTAVTFLVLVATQFQGIRKLERETLQALDRTLLVPRGPDYIEGIAAVFEARNYLVMGVALLSSGTATLLDWRIGVLVGAACVGLSLLARSGLTIGDVAVIKEAPVRFEGPSLYVDDIYIMNVAPEALRAPLRRWAKGFIIESDRPSVRDKLARVGQRQAIVHDLTSVLGTRQDISAPEFTPMVRKDHATGRLGVYVVPFTQDAEALLRVIRQVPLLETARGSQPQRFLDQPGKERRHEQR